MLVFGLFCLCTISGSAVIAGDATNSVPTEARKVEQATFPVIDSLTEYWRAEAREISRPIKLELLVDYYEGGWNHLFGRVGGEDGYMPCATTIPIHSHDRVLIEGTVYPRKGLSAETAHFSILERNVPYTSIQVQGPTELADFTNLRHKIVTFEAMVERQWLTGKSPDHLQMTLLAGLYKIRLFQWDRQAKLIDVKRGTRVKITGVYSPKFDPQTDTLEIDLWVANREDIVVVGDLESDPHFESPVVPIENLAGLSPGNVREVHVAGRVRSYLPGQSVVLRDETGEVRARTLQTLPLQTGDWVEAVGDPYVGSTDWLLRAALVRPALPQTVAQLKSRDKSASQKIRLTDQVLALSPAEAAKSLPVDLLGVVTWSDPEANFWYLQDSSGAVQVQMMNEVGKSVPLQAQVHLTGSTVPGVFASQLRGGKFEVLGVMVLPIAERVTLDQAMTGLHEGMRVELSGHVQRVYDEGAYTRLILSTPTGTFSVVITREENVKNMVGSIISVQGVCRAVANHRRQLTSIEILLNSRDDIRLEHAPLSDPFAEPLREVRALRQFRVNSAANDWARVKGVVTRYQPGRAIIIQDGNEGLTVRSEQVDAVAVGDLIEATGLPGLEQGHVLLREAAYRKLAQGAEVDPVIVSDAHNLDENLDNLLTKVSGKLLSTALDAQSLNFSIQSEKTVFTASLPISSQMPDATEWSLGARLQLTGVYQVVRDERQDPQGFHLLLRSPSDVVVIENSSWWTPTRAFAVTVSLVGCIALGLTWVAALRRRVARQTGQIRLQILSETKLEAHNRAIVANASDCIFTTDLAGNFTSLNPAGERLLGYSQAELTRINVRAVIDPSEREAHPDFFSTLHSADQAAARFELRLVAKDAHCIWTEISACLIHIEGKAVGLLGVVRDIGERKQIEEQLKRARDAAQANTEAKSAFLANMSHEIRTPMNGVIGMSNLLLETRLSEEQREYTETVRNSAEALLTVLNDILDFSKIEAGKLEIESLDFDLVNCMKESLELLAARASAKGLELALFVSPEVSRHLRGDPGRLRQILLNLAGNAVKFTSQGEVTVSVFQELAADDTVTLRFEVQDTGVGISKEEIGRLFHPFSQADVSTTRRFGGTGLGLAISKQIVGLLQGQINVESAPGQGSCFSFTARFARQPLTPGQPLPLPELGGARILYCGQVTATRRAVMNYFKAWGLRGEFSATAEEARERVEKAHEVGDPIRIVLLDSPAIGKSGFALASGISAHPLLPRTAWILLSSAERLSTPGEIESLGLQAVVKKPVHPDELRAALVGGLAPHDKPPTDLTPSLGTRSPLLRQKEEPASSIRLLVAEDNVVNQRVVQLQLKKLGYQGTIANNGSEVLAALRNTFYDIVLMDCQMPEMDGYQVTRIIKEDPRLSKIHIIAMTANAMQGDREKCLEAGMDDYVTKPLRLEDLRAALRRGQDAVAEALSKETEESSQETGNRRWRR